MHARIPLAAVAYRHKFPFGGRPGRLHPAALVSYALAGLIGLLLLSGCQPANEVKPAEVAPVEPRDYAAEVEALLPPVEYTDELNEYTLYRTLIGEFAGQRGHLEIAVENYLALAQHTRELDYAQRATKIAVFARDHEAALSAAEIWVSVDPSDLEGRRILAVMLVNAGEVDAAMPHLEYVMASDNPGEQINLVANLLGRVDNRNQTYEVMRRLLELKPDDPDFLFAHAMFALRAGARTEAEASLDKVIKTHGVDTGRLVAFISVLQTQEDIPSALKWMQVAVERAPTNNELRLYYARLLGEAGRFDEARVQFERLTELHPNNPEVIYSLGLLHVQAGRMDAATERFEELLGLGMRQAESHFYLAQIAESQGNRADAIGHYEQIVDSQRGFEARTRIAYLKSVDGDVDGALFELDRVSPIGPEQQDFLVQIRGEILTVHGRYEEAFQLYNEALADSDDTDLLYARAMVAERLGRMDILEQDLKSVIEREPDNAQALNALGYTLADRTDRLQEARGYIERALEISPADFYILDSMGWVLYRMGEFEQAVAFLEQARDLRNDPEVAAHLGEVLWVLGDVDAARDVLESALRDTPDDERLLDLRQRLVE